MSGNLPLKGIRIVDLGQILAMPFATQWAALMGAEVISLESRERLSHRFRPPYADDVPGIHRSGGFNMSSANKLSCSVNLRSEEGHAIVLDLVRVADVMTENFSTGTLERLGLGYPELVRVRPDIILLSLSAAGRTGPMKQFVGFHSAVTMLSGLAAITGYPQDHPRVLGSVFPDPLSGMYAVFALLAGLYRRSRTGAGGHIDVAMTEAMMALMPEAIIDYTLNGRESRRAGNADLSKAPYGVYRCRGEDTWLAISVSSDGQWTSLCDATGNPEWSDDPRFSNALTRWNHRDGLDLLVQSWTSEQDPEEAMALLQGAGVPAGRSLTALDLLEDAHLRERGFIVEVDHPEVGRRPTPGVPWRITDLPAVEVRHAPLFAEHNQYVLCELLGLTTRQVERLAREGAVN